MDPYTVLGVTPGVSESELRSAYRRAVQRTHPDHNPSPDAAREFETVQDAWTSIRRLRDRPGATRAAEPRPADPKVEDRLAAMEAELRRARAARQAAERAEREAREAARQARRDAAGGDGEDRPSDEELGYIRTDDSLGKIFSDALGGLREKPVTERAADLLDEVADALRDGRRKRSP